MSVNRATLETIRVLWRRPDTMELWGIPYDMREGQAPRDLYNGRRIPDTCAIAAGRYGATIHAPGVREDWIYLGAPGWWGSLSAHEQALIEAYLAKIAFADGIPSSPGEWLKIRRCRGCSCVVPIGDGVCDDCMESPRE